MRKNHAIFSIIRLDPGVIWIVDMCVDGMMSVTNDAEEVIKQLGEHRSLKGVRVFYRDSAGCWDELVHNGHQTFIEFSHGTDGLEPPYVPE